MISGSGGSTDVQLLFPIANSIECRIIITNVALTDDAMLTFSIRLSLAKLLSAGQRGRVAPMELI